MTEDPDLRPASVLAHGGRRPDPAGGDVAPAIRPSSNYARDEAYKLPEGGGSYTRDANPAYPPLEAMLARLEGGTEALLYGSGMAAATAVLHALRPGDHIVLQHVLYWGVRDWMLSFAKDWGLEIDLVEAADTHALAAAIRPGATRLVWIETPANPTWDIVDIAAAAGLAHEAGARLVVDSTVATPILTRPIEHGADLVMHSATKALNGHGDVLAGVLVAAARDDFWARLRAGRPMGGAVLGPFETWLLQRGLRTLHLRVERACANALALARHFEGHPKLKAVLYPGLESHPHHALAKQQMTGGFGYGLSLRVRGGAEAALELCGACALMVRATSLGGTETLIEHRASAEGPGSPVPPDLLRLSVGIEDPGDLIADLERALAKI